MANDVQPNSLNEICFIGSVCVIAVFYRLSHTENNKLNNPVVIHEWKKEEEEARMMRGGRQNGSYGEKCFCWFFDLKSDRFPSCSDSL